MSAQTVNLGVAKLESSGLSSADARGLHLTFLEASETAAIDPSFHSAPSIRIDYRDPNAPDKPLAAHPKWPPFFRIRYLTEVRNRDGEVVRYSQPPATGVCAYFPKNQEWPRITKDPTVPLYFTEGEFKAAKACKEGFPTIGLGGVNNISNKRQHVMFLPELEAVDWVRRRVYIIFDSDIKQKPGVAAALNALAEELVERGALPSTVILPESGSKKVGLDDYLLDHTAAQLQDLVDYTSEPLTIARPLWDLNDSAVYVDLPGVIAMPERGLVYTDKQFRGAFANRIVHEQKMNPKNPATPMFTKTNAADAWLKWPLRRTACEFVFLPGQPSGVIPGPKGYTVLNSWTGWGVEPAKGDVKPFLALVKAVFKTMEPGAMEWFMQWLAYPIQHPGAKLKSAVLVYSRFQGTGKSFIGDIMRGIYGMHAGVVTNTELESQFNRWAKDRQFIVANEVLGNDNRRHANTLKNLISETVIPINDKNIPSYDLNNCTQFYFTTNHIDGIYIDDQDRRFFVIETGTSESPEFYAPIDKWFKDPKKTGLAALHYYLLNSVDCSTFNPEGKAFVTNARKKMVKATRSSIEEWCINLATDPDSVLYQGRVQLLGDLMTAKLLLSLFDATGCNTGGKVTSITIGRHLTSAGLEQANTGSNINVPGNTPPQAIYWIVRNKERWLKASHKDCVAHIKKTQGGAQ